MEDGNNASWLTEPLASGAAAVGTKEWLASPLGASAATTEWLISPLKTAELRASHYGVSSTHRSLDSSLHLSELNHGRRIINTDRLTSPVPWTEETSTFAKYRGGVEQDQQESLPNNPVGLFKTRHLIGGLLQTGDGHSDHDDYYIEDLHTRPHFTPHRHDMGSESEPRLYTRALEGEYDDDYAGKLDLERQATWSYHTPHHQSQWREVLGGVQPYITTTYVSDEEEAIVEGGEYLPSLASSGYRLSPQATYDPDEVHSQLEYYHQAEYHYQPRERAFSREHYMHSDYVDHFRASELAETAASSHPGTPLPHYHLRASSTMGDEPAASSHYDFRVESASKPASSHYDQRTDSTSRPALLASLPLPPTSKAILPLESSIGARTPQLTLHSSLSPTIPERERADRASYQMPSRTPAGSSRVPRSQLTADSTPALSLYSFHRPPTSATRSDNVDRLPWRPAAARSQTVSSVDSGCLISEDMQLDDLEVGSSACSSTLSLSQDCQQLWATLGGPQPWRRGWPDHHQVDVAASSQDQGHRQTNTALSPSWLTRRQHRRTQSLERHWDQTSGKLTISAIQAMKKSVTVQLPSPPRNQGRPRQQHSKVETEVAELHNTSQSPAGVPREGLGSLQRMTSVLFTIKLLDLLHSVPVHHREQVVAKAYWFRKWHHNVRLLKRARREETIKWVRAVEFHRWRLTQRVFRAWQAVGQAKMAAAKSLSQRHLLIKGLSGLQWAVQQAKQVAIAADLNQNRKRLLRHFHTWKDQLEDRRREIVRKAFNEWKWYHSDMKRERLLNNMAERHILLQMYKVWRERFTTERKITVANLHYKIGLLSVGLEKWRAYTLDSKVKNARNRAATVFYEEHNKRRAIATWKEEAKKYQLARTFYRRHFLAASINVWKRETLLTRAEHICQISLAKEHRRTVQLRSTFSLWQLNLKVVLMKKQKTIKCIRRAFLIWKLKMQRNTMRRQITESMARKALKKRVLYHWLSQVKGQREARDKAIAVFEKIQLKRVFSEWKKYTTYKAVLREKMKHFWLRRELFAKQRCLIVWLQRLHGRLTAQEIRSRWSRGCVQRAWTNWRAMVHRKQVEVVYNSTQIQRDRKLLRCAFQLWKDRQAKREVELARAVGARQVLERNRMLRILTQWRILVREGKTISPIVHRRKTRTLSCAFYAWLGVVLEKKRQRNLLQIHKIHQLNGFFSTWRDRTATVLREKHAVQQLGGSQAKRCLQGWRSVVERSHQCRDFQKQLELNNAREFFDKWKVTFENRQLVKEMKFGEEARERVLKSYFLKQWKEGILQQNKENLCLVKATEVLLDTTSLKKAFAGWKKAYQMQQLARHSQMDHQVHSLRKVLQAWHQYASHCYTESSEKFKLSLLGLASSPGSSHGSDPLTSDPLLTPLSSNNEGDAATSSGYHSNSALGNQGQSPRAVFSDGEDASGRGDRIGSSSDFSEQLSINIPGGRKEEYLRHVILRWRHWPVSVAFEQWREYVGRRQALKKLKKDAEQMREDLTIHRAFAEWRRQREAMENAKAHNNERVKAGCFQAWLSYTLCRKRKCHRSEVAEQYSRSRYLSAAFIIWRKKLSERYRMMGVVLSWQEYVAENVQLEGRARRMQDRVSTATLQECFQLWKARANQISHVNNYYNHVLITRCFHQWKDWTRERVERLKKMKKFQEYRLKRMVMSLWVLRLRQKCEVEERERSAMTHRLRRVIWSWHYWAAGNRLRQAVGRELRQVFQLLLLKSVWRSWKQEAYKAQQMRTIYSTNLSSRVLRSWHQAAHDLRLNRTKCQQLKSEFDRRRLASSFSNWQSMHQKYRLVVEQKERRVVSLTRRYFQYWRECTLCTRASKHRNTSLLSQAFEQWHEKCMRKRALQSLVLQIALHWRRTTQRAGQLETVADEYRGHLSSRLVEQTFATWREAAERGRLASNHYRLALHRRCFIAWHTLTERRKAEKVAVMEFKQRTAYNQLFSTFLIWKNEMVISQTHQQMVTYQQQKGEKSLLKQVLHHWKFAVLQVKAEKHHSSHLLTEVWLIWRGHHNRLALAKKHQNNAYRQRLASALFGESAETECFGKDTLAVVFCKWKAEVEKVRMAKQHYQNSLQSRSLDRWVSAIRKKLLLQRIQAEVMGRHQLYLLHQFFNDWKLQYKWSQHCQLIVNKVLATKRAVKLKTCFDQWRKETNEARASQHHQRVVVERAVRKWKKFAKERREDARHERDLEELADHHYQSILGKLVLKAWASEAKAGKHLEIRKRHHLVKSWNRWKTKVDMQLTAKHLALFKTYNKVWKIWRKGLIRSQVSKTIVSQDMRKCRLETFDVWHRMASLKHLENTVKAEQSQAQLRVSFLEWRHQYNSLSTASQSSPESSSNNMSTGSSDW